MKTYLEPEEVKRLIETADNLRDKLMIQLLFSTGCRISELLGLTLDDIDFEQGTITIKHLKSRLNLNCPKCGEKLGRRHKFCPGCGRSLE